MSTTTEQSRALNTTLQLETDRSASWLANLFEVFEAPLESDGVCHQVGFFQIFNSRLKAVKEQQPPLTPATVTEDAFTPTSAPIADDSAVSATMSTGEGDPVTDDRPSNQRPYSLVVSCNTQIFKPSNQQPYYIFPHNAIVETVTQVPPYELFCSFYTVDLVPERQQEAKNDIDNSNSVSSSISTLNNQPRYTDLMSSSLLFAGAPDVMMDQAMGSTSSTHLGALGALVTHLSLSAVSRGLYSIIKETVAGFEATYGKMIQLMKLHTQAVSDRQEELLYMDKSNGTKSRKPTSETKPAKGKRKGSIQQRQSSPRAAATVLATIKPRPITSPKDTNRSVPKPSPGLSAPSPPNPDLATSSAPLLSTTSHRQSMSSTNGRKCAYCGSKTTPMWRRGPEGAGTLCNACGVKWKHGKILCSKPPDQGSPAMTSTVSNKSSAAAAAAAANDHHKKRKQHGGLDIKNDKRIKIKGEQQRQKQLLQNNQYQPNHANGSAPNGMMPVDGDTTGDDDEYTDDDSMEDFHESNDEEEYDDFDQDIGDDDDDDERMNNNIVAARHLTIHEDRHHPYHAATPLLTPTPPHSRSRSMTTSVVPSYMAYQQQHYQQEQGNQQQQYYQQDDWPIAFGNQQQSHYHPYHEENQQRPRRHTADVSILDRAPWGELPLSMGVDAVEAATVLTLLKRS